MKCRKYKGLASKNVSENKNYITKEDKESKEIARKFKSKTRMSKKL